MSDKLLVGQINELAHREESLLHTRFADMSVSDSGAHITVKDDLENEHTFDLDDVTERALAEFMDINPTYLDKCPADLKAHNLNYWLRKQPEVRAMLLTGPKGIETVYDPDDSIITVPTVAQMISRVFDPENEIVSLFSDTTKFHVDVMTENRIIVPGNGIGDRPDAEGYVRRSSAGGSPWLDTDAVEINDEDGSRKVRLDDITHGGIRIITHPTKPKDPVVERYFNRLVCMNGMTYPHVDERITLKGHTVPEVLAEMERACEQLLGSMDDALEKYAESSQIRVPGNALAYIRQVGAEQNVPRRIVDRALDYAAAGGLAQADNVSQYDVLNIFTSLANGNAVRYSTMLRLQRLGGDMAFRADEYTRRCNACERPMPTVGGGHVH